MHVQVILDGVTISDAIVVYPHGAVDVDPGIWIPIWNTSRIVALAVGDPHDVSQTVAIEVCGQKHRVLLHDERTFIIGTNTECFRRVGTTSQQVPLQHHRLHLIPSPVLAGNGREPFEFQRGSVGEGVVGKNILTVYVVSRHCAHVGQAIVYASPHAADDESALRAGVHPGIAEAYVVGCPCVRMSVLPV